MVEQRPSKPHVWVRFLLSLYMLFKKPSIFVFKKKLNVLNSRPTRYVKGFKIANINTQIQINLTLNKADVTTSLFNQLLKKRNSVFRKILFKKWNVKRHFKMKFFAKTSLNLLYYPKNLQLKMSSNNFTFLWNTQTFQKFNVNWVRSYIFSTTPSNFIPIKTLTLNTNLKSYYFWINLLTHVYQINRFNSFDTTLFKQLTKFFYLNHTSSQLTNSHFFYTNRIGIKVDEIHNVLSNQLSSVSTPTNKNLSLTKKHFSFPRLLVILSKYLPHMNLVRLFRRTRNKKTLHYSVDKTLFFKNPLIRINLDYKFNNLNTLKTPLLTIFKQNTFSLFIRSLSRDNLLENTLDSTLTNVISAVHHTPFAKKSKHNYLKLIDSNISSWKKLSSNSLLFFDFLNIQTILQQPLLYKYVFWLVTPNNNVLSNLTYSLTSLNDHSFSTRINVFKTTNIWPSSFFHFTLKRKILKIFSFNKFLPNVTMWYYNILIRFMESCTGKKVFLKLNPFIENSLSFTDIARCNMWSIRINSFQKLLGPKIFLNESLRIMHIALRFKDPTFFANWIKGMLNRMSFWKYRLLFRYIKFAMRYLFWLYFSELQFKGLKLKLKGKISVAGNARTRTLVYRIGETGYSKIDNRVICDSSTINTFTGVLGFKIWFFF